MAAMLVLVCLLILMMVTMMKSDAASAEIITARSGEAVLLPSGLQEAKLEHMPDIRWTHPHLLISLKTNRTTCHHGRCELLRKGSLRFSRVQPEDSGNYTLQVFDEQGRRLTSKDFVLRVEDISSSSSSSSNSGVVVSALTCCFFLLLLFIIIILFILMRRRSQRAATGPLQDVYVVMHSNYGNKRKEEEKQEREECYYVPYHAGVSMETPITQQMSKDVEGIYV